MCWLISRKAKIRTPGQTSKQKKKKVFLRRLPLSRFLPKILRVNKITMKSFSEISVLRSPLMHKIKAQNISVSDPEVCSNLNFHSIKE